MRVMGRSHSDSSTAAMAMMAMCDAEPRRNRSSARGEHRRHTITTITGLDHHTVAAVQQQEALGSALRALDSARGRLQDEVTGRGRRDAGAPPQGHPADVNPARLGQLYHRIQEATRILAEVTESAKAGTCGAEGYGPPTAPSASVLQQALCVLRDQNRLLTREVSEKSDRISQLEHEKSLLIQQLFEARSRHHGNASLLADSTFI
ncbi:suppressor APC domain-containing protein 2-like [Lethenteron reissneri]|uniref:suppressor APC domain-containing protein 2-like n=1 Tax=Lethenteron reissneri TaxID=7753 RepID=UPI002AB6B9C7|nr:suppressor APC domain-containing protein 2-like [Lethenteron reissneri]